MSRILLVEDDTKLAQQVVDWLTMERHSVEHVSNGRDALEFLEQRSYDIIVLDWQLPELQGIDILKRYRAAGGTSRVVMLTGKATLQDKETGLDAGADDYLTKPFHPRELSARLRALNRRPNALVSDQLRVGNILLQPSTFTVTRNGQRIKLLPLEFAVLEFLMRNPGRVFPAEALLERVWPVNSDTAPDAVRTIIKTLRKKLERQGGFSPIRTIYGVGYKIEECEAPAEKSNS
jgi:two-component system OmpR family response regulator